MTYDPLEELMIPEEIDVEDTLWDPPPPGNYTLTVTGFTTGWRSNDEGQKLGQYIQWTLAAQAEDNPNLEPGEDFEVNFFTDFFLTEAGKEDRLQRAIARIRERQGPNADVSDVRIRPPILQTYRFLWNLGLMERELSGQEGRRKSYSYRPVGWEDLRDGIRMASDRKVVAEIEITERDGQRWPRIKRGPITPFYG